jgi:putative ABC transport system permease protein
LKLKDPAETHQVVDRIKILLPSYPVYAMEDFLSQVASGVREVSSQFVNAIVGIAVVIGFLVVLLSMYSAILERTREIGILKSLGASRTWIVGIVLRETVVVCLAGIVAGMAISYGAREAVGALFPLLSILIAPSWLAWSALIAVLGALFGALYPAARAARHDPIHALTYD